MGRVRSPRQTRSARLRRRHDRSLQWDHIDSVPSLSSVFSRLPSSLIRDHIFSFLAPTPTQSRSFLHGFDQTDSYAALASIHVVCQHWCTLSQFLLNETDAALCEVAMYPASRSAMRADMRSAKRRGQRIKQLELTFEADDVSKVDPTMWNRFLCIFPTSYCSISHWLEIPWSQQ